jgi:hypothetical protein
MRFTPRTMVTIFLAVLCSALLGVASTLTAAVTWGATAALIMGGSGLGDPTVITDAGLRVPIPNYIPNVVNYYIAPNSTCEPTTCRLVPVVTPEGLLPPLIGNTTFDPSVAEGVEDLETALQDQLTNHPEEQVVVFGYSQSGDIITKTLRNFADDPTTAPPKAQVSFVVIGNTNRPNGGILARFPGLYIPVLNVTLDGAAPTDTGYKTTDIAFEYDPVADFPQYPINLLADLNALIGFIDVHATYPNPYLPLPAGIPFFPTDLPNGYTPAELQQAMNDPQNRQTYGDTTYITIPTKTLPILDPFLDIGTLTGTRFLIEPVVDLIQPTLRVLIDLGYDRTVPFGQPTPAGLFPKIDPSELKADLDAAVRQGIHDALADVGVTSIGPVAAGDGSEQATTLAGDKPPTTPPDGSSVSTAAATAAITPNSDTAHNSTAKLLTTAVAAVEPTRGAATPNSADEARGGAGTVWSPTRAAKRRAPISSVAAMATKPERPARWSPEQNWSSRGTRLAASDTGVRHGMSTATAEAAHRTDAHATGASSSAHRDDGAGHPTHPHLRP